MEEAAHEGTGKLEVFGPNVVSTDGDEWRLHSRTAHISFGEGLQDMVWDEARRQTKALCQAWSKTSDNDLQDSLYKLTMNTTCHAIFGRRSDWAGDQEPLTNGHAMSLLTSLTNVMQHLIYVLVLPKWLLRILPGRRPKLASLAYSECNQYMEEFIHQEKARMRSVSGDHANRQRRDNLLTSLVRSADALAGPVAQDTLAGGETDMSNAATKGNIFIYLFAGEWQPAFAPVELLRND